MKRLIYKFKIWCLCGFSFKKYRKFMAFQKKSDELYEQAFLDAFLINPLDFNEHTEEVEVKSNNFFVKAEECV